MWSADFMSQHLLPVLRLVILLAMAFTVLHFRTVSRLRRPFLSDRYFFVIVELHRTPHDNENCRQQRRRSVLRCPHREGRVFGGEFVHDSLLSISDLGFRSGNGCFSALLPQFRYVRKNVRMSWANNSGSSIAAKWPPRGISVHC